MELIAFLIACYDDPFPNPGCGDCGPAAADPAAFDLLSLLEMPDADLGHRTTRTKKTTSKPQPNKTQTESTEATFAIDGPTGDPFLDDPCLRAFVSPDDIAALQASRDICRMHDSHANVQDWAHATEETNSASGSDLEDVQLDDADETNLDAGTSNSSTEKSQPSESPMLEPGACLWTIFRFPLIRLWL